MYLSQSSILVPTRTHHQFGKDNLLGAKKACSTEKMKTNTGDKADQLTE
jgi:hypothetical protein